MMTLHPTAPPEPCANFCSYSSLCHAAHRAVQVRFRPPKAVQSRSLETDGRKESGLGKFGGCMYVRRMCSSQGKWAKVLIDKSILVLDALVCEWMRLIGSGPEILRRPPGTITSHLQLHPDCHLFHHRPSHESQRHLRGQASHLRGVGKLSRWPGSPPQWPSRPQEPPSHAPNPPPHTLQV